MSNLGLEQAVSALGLDFFRSSVGDRYVMEMLVARQLILGGESSGHIINLDLTTTGDGIVTALQVLEEMTVAGRKLHELKGDMHKYPQKLNNVQLQSKVNLGDYPELDKIIQEAVDELGGKGRVLLRPSGTEPLVRIMVEGQDEALVDVLVQNLTDRVENILRDHI
jgi:phosphoglucosamine mutase